jgi:hypothetical protein
MSDRGITQEEVEHVLENHYATMPGNKPGRVRYHGEVRTRVLVVIAVPLARGHRVITAYFTG